MCNTYICIYIYIYIYIYTCLRPSTRRSTEGGSGPPPTQKLQPTTIIYIYIIHIQYIYIYIWIHTHNINIYIYIYTHIHTCIERERDRTVQKCCSLLSSTQSAGKRAEIIPAAASGCTGGVRPFFILRIVRPRIVESKLWNHCAKKLDGALRKSTSFV